VVDVQHKPRGLTSLSRYHLSQMHMVQHKPRKKFSWGHNQFWSKGLRVCCQVAHRTLSGAPGLYTLKPATLGFLLGALHYNSVDYLVCHRTSGEPAKQRLPARQRSTAKVYSAKQCRAEVRTQKSEVTGLSGVAPDCSVQQKDKALQRSTAPNPDGRADVARTGE
jgi:hypothetical protein